MKMLLFPSNLHGMIDTAPSLLGKLCLEYQEESRIEWLVEVTTDHQIINGNINFRKLAKVCKLQSIFPFWQSVAR